MRRPRLRSAAKFLGKVLVYLVALLIVVLGVALLIVETGWAKNQLRALLVRQASQYLTATLEIGRLRGSLLRGLELGDIRLTRDGQPIVTIDDVILDYSLRELWQEGTTIRRIRLVRPRIVASKMEDGRWDLSALVRREARQEERSGPARPIQILAIEVQDGAVQLRDPLQFGAAHIPTDFQRLDATFSYTYRPVTWMLRFTNVTFVGREPGLTLNKLSGGIGNGPDGLTFDELFIETPRTTFTIDGRIERGDQPTNVALDVRADRFAFQEWGGMLHGLRNIAIDASFETRLRGPLDRIATDLDLEGSGGSVSGNLVLNTRVSGWRGAGTLNVGRLDLARWLSRPDKPSDITGRVVFDLDLNLGGFPRGTYTFDGPHAAFMGYAADNVHARGRLTRTHTEIDALTAAAYGAKVTATRGSTIGLDAPYPYRFRGAIAGIDLRRLPPAVPVPHVESSLTFAYDVTGTFSQPYIIGRALFQPSVFLGASIGTGTVGAIDTLAKPLAYSGEGHLAEVSLHRFGEGLDVEWMRAPRYAGTLSGHFHVRGAGSDRATMSLTGGGRLERAEMFHGTLLDADVGVEIAQGTLTATYDGGLAQIDPAVALDDPRFNASLSGRANMRTTVRDLLVRTPTLKDYDITATAALEESIVRTVSLDSATFRGGLHDGVLRVDELRAEGPAVAGRVVGAVDFTETGTSMLEYDLTQVDLAQLKGLTGQDASGVASTKGGLSGPYNALRLEGSVAIANPRASGIDALTLNGDYDLTIPAGDVARPRGTFTGRASFPVVFGQALREASGTIAMADERIGFDLRLVQAEGRNGALKGSAILHADRHAVDLADLAVTLGAAPWRLASAGAPPTVSWTGEEIAVEPLVFLGGESADQRIELSGTWRSDGNGALQITARRVFLETLEGAFQQPARYGGVLDLDATIRGTRDSPIVTGQMAVVNGRIQRVTYEKLAGRVDYTDGMFAIDLRLDQEPGVWLTAAGTVPLALFRKTMPERPLDVAIRSSPIDLGLVEGLTDVVRDVSGTMDVDVRAVGTSHDPHFEGMLELVGAAFIVNATGAPYQNARASVQLERDRIVVHALHLEDRRGHPLEVHGSLATHELKVGDLEIDVTAQQFELLRNEFGFIEANATLALRGRFDRPRLGGAITIGAGDLNVDQILERTLLQPYATQPAPAIPQVDAAAALNPWERLGLDIELHVPNTLRLSGENVQVAAGTPIGLGDINLRVLGDLYLYKDPGRPLSVTGSLDSVSGRYAFQGRNFDVDPTSSINFRGDLNPEIWVTVKRVINGVEARVTIAGPLRTPELQLASTPPLPTSDILSLIVFNTSANQLSGIQQEELAVRAGALAAGFLATPIISALQNELRLDILQIEAPTAGAGRSGPRITVGDEIAPGLVARFSRQFGADAYDEVIVEYYLSRLLRLRATFSDAQSLNTRAPFQRHERAGIDLLLFFSF